MNGKLLLVNKKYVLIIVIFVAGFIFINQAQGSQTEESSITAQKTSYGTRILISTSGPVKFSSFWLNNPLRLVIKFRSRNILSKMDKEIIVNQGVIKRITSFYYGRRRNKSLKYLIFEVTQKVPYEIRQEDNAIILDIQTALEPSVFHVADKEVPTVSVTSDVMIEDKLSLEPSEPEVNPVREQSSLTARADGGFKSPSASSDDDHRLKLVAFSNGVNEQISKEVKKGEEEVISAKAEPSLSVQPTKKEKTMTVGMVFWLVSLALILSSVFLVRRRGKTNIGEKLKRLKEEKEQIKPSSALLREEFVEKEEVKEKLSTEEKEAPGIPEKFQGRRLFPRLSLSRDFNKTIIARIEFLKIPQEVKCFINNISSGGLCFETKKVFKEKEPVNLKLFFYGDQVPMMKIQGRIVWKKVVGSINRYGVCFESLKEKDKLALNRYIEKKLSES